ncbi:hypothetical protein AAZX31_08G240700 [Glycine max]
MAFLFIQYTASRKGFRVHHQSLISWSVLMLSSLTLLSHAVFHIVLVIEGDQWSTVDAQWDQLIGFIRVQSWKTLLREYFLDGFGLEEGGIRASSVYSSSHEIEEHDNEQPLDGLQDRVNLLKRLSGDINEEVDRHNHMLDRMGNDMDASRGVLSGTMDKFKMCMRYLAHNGFFEIVRIHDNIEEKEAYALTVVSELHPEHNKSFNETMASDSQMMNLVLRDCNWVLEGLESIVDVGGGTGITVKITC